MKDMMQLKKKSIVAGMKQFKFNINLKFESHYKVDYLLMLLQTVCEWVSPIL